MSLHYLTSVIMDNSDNGQRHIKLEIYMHFQIFNRNRSPIYNSAKKQKCHNKTYNDVKILYIEQIKLNNSMFLYYMK